MACVCGRSRFVLRDMGFARGGSPLVLRAMAFARGMACMREAAGFTVHSRMFVFTCLLRRAPYRRYCRKACVQILLPFRPRVFCALKLCLLRMFLLDIGKSRQAAAWQVRNECQCVVVDRHFPP